MGLIRMRRGRVVLEVLVVSAIMLACSTSSTGGEPKGQDSFATVTETTPPGSISVQVEKCILRTDEKYLLLRLGLTGGIGEYRGSFGLAEPTEARALNQRGRPYASPGALEAADDGQLRVGIAGVSEVPASLELEYPQVVADGVVALAAADLPSLQGLTLTTPFGPEVGGSFEVTSAISGDDGAIEIVIQNKPTRGDYAILGSREAILTLGSSAFEGGSLGLESAAAGVGEIPTASQTFRFDGASEAQSERPLRLSLGRWVAVLRDPVRFDVPASQCREVPGGEPFPSTIPTVEPVD